MPASPPSVSPHPSAAPSSSASPSPQFSPPVSPLFPAPLCIHAWSLVLSLLPPRDIAHAALAYSSLAAAAAAVTAARAADATGGSEPRAVPFLAPDRQSRNGDRALPAPAELGAAARTSSASVPRYSYFRYCRTNVRLAASDASSFPSLLLRPPVNPAEAPQAGGPCTQASSNSLCASSRSTSLPPYPYPQPPWWWGVVPSYLQRAERTQQPIEASQQWQQQRGGGPPQQQQQQVGLENGEARTQGRGQSDARKRKREVEAETEGEAEAEEAEAEQRARAQQALQPHALEDALTSLLPAFSPRARKGEGKGAWPGSGAAAGIETIFEAPQKRFGGEAGAAAGIEPACDGSRAGSSHRCCNRVHCPCAMPLRSGAQQGGNAGAAEGGGGEEGGGERWDEGEQGADDEEAGDADVVYECGPFCSCARQQSTGAATCSGASPANGSVKAPRVAAAASSTEALACVHCPNRSSQRGLQWRLAIVWSDVKGWSLVAQERIPGRSLICQYAVWSDVKGWSLVAQERIPGRSLICQYAGELLTRGEASARQAVYDGIGTGAMAGGRNGARESRGSRNYQHLQQQQQEKEQKQEQEQSHPHHQHTPHPLPAPRAPPRFLFTLREHLPSGAVLRTHIDPSRIGSLGRFMNHQCGGGNVARVVVRQAGCLLPAVGLVARREIASGEELT
ncbi:hypothetical protein CLOP_g25520 [Closterium sp. NIES-67]|nr:hypothetical protein CLOP_g25520 [Closterium sp. NIES-67]